MTLSPATLALLDNCAPGALWPYRNAILALALAPEQDPRIASVFKQAYLYTTDLKIKNTCLSQLSEKYPDELCTLIDIATVKDLPLVLSILGVIPPNPMAFIDFIWGALEEAVLHQRPPRTTQTELARIVIKKVLRLLGEHPLLLDFPRAPILLLPLLDEYEHDVCLLPDLVIHCPSLAPVLEQNAQKATRDMYYYQYAYSPSLPPNVRTGLLLNILLGSSLYYSVPLERILGDIFAIWADIPQRHSAVKHALQDLLRRNCLSVRDRLPLPPPALRRSLLSTLVNLNHPQRIGPVETQKFKASIAAFIWRLLSDPDTPLQAVSMHLRPALHSFPPAPYDLAPFLRRPLSSRLMARLFASAPQELRAQILASLRDTRAGLVDTPPTQE